MRPPCSLPPSQCRAVRADATAKAIVGAICLALVLPTLSACRSGSPTGTYHTIAPRSTENAIFTVPADQYAAAFEAAREVLLRYRFTLERVDAAQGVITTRPRESSGLASPWDSEFTTIGQEIEDVAHRQQRAVRIAFDPPETQPTSQPTAETPQLRRARVEVWIERWYVKGQRPSSRAILFSTPTTDPIASRKGMPSEFPVATSRDEVLAARLARDIGDRLKR
jgi:hypothetical protein